jgi:hypothetical protein
MKDWPLMKLPRGEFLLLPLSATALVIASSVAWAQAYPTRIVMWVFPI